MGSATRRATSIRDHVGPLTFDFNRHNTTINGLITPALMAKHEFRMTDSCYLRPVDFKFAAGNIIGLLILEMNEALKLNKTRRDEEIAQIRRTGIFAHLNICLGFRDSKYRDPTLQMIEAGFERYTKPLFNNAIELEAYEFGFYARSLCPRS